MSADAHADLTARLRANATSMARRGIDSLAAACTEAADALDAADAENARLTADRQRLADIAADVMRERDEALAEVARLTAERIALRDYVEGQWTLTENAERERDEALAEVARLTAERDRLAGTLVYWKNLLTTRTAKLCERAERAEAYRDEARARVAERDATIERLRDLLAKVPLSMLTEHRGGNYGGQVCRICRQFCSTTEGGAHAADCLVLAVRAVLAEAAPTPETPSKADRHVVHARNCWCLNDGAECCDPSCCSEGSR